MNDFKLPIIKDTKVQKRILSMDEYVEFVHFNLKNIFDKASHSKWKKKLAVDVPFSL